MAWATLPALVREMAESQITVQKNINNWLRINAQKKYSTAKVYFDDKSGKKPIFAGKNYFCQSCFYRGQNRCFPPSAKTCQPWESPETMKAMQVT